MKITANFLTALFILFGIHKNVFAQNSQLIGLSQQNLECYNPAYSVSDSTDRLNFTSSLLFEKQKSFPSSHVSFLTVGSYTKQLNKNTALTTITGLTIYRDKYRFTSVSVNLAHKIKLNEKSELSVGGSMGFARSKYFQHYTIHSIHSDNYQEELKHRGTLGMGFVYTRKNFTIGASVYRNVDVYQRVANYSKFGRERLFMNITMNKSYTINNNWKGEIHLAVLGGRTGGINLSHGFVYKDKFTFGVGNRIGGYYSGGPYAYVGYKFKNLDFKAAVYLPARNRNYSITRADFSISYKLK